MQESTPFKKAPGMKFAEMSRKQKYVFVAKLMICIATFGFVFPNVQSS